MSSPLLHQPPDDPTAAPDTKHADGASPPSSVRITVIVQHRPTFDSPVATGRQIKDTAGVPEGFALYRRAQGGNEPVPDDAQVELHHGDHFFARPTWSGA